MSGMDSSEMGKRGGRARAKALSAERRLEIALKASIAAKKIRSKKQKRVYELLIALYDHLAKGWRIYPHTLLGEGPETILQRVAELLREFANKK